MQVSNKPILPAEAFNSMDADYEHKELAVSQGKKISSYSKSDSRLPVFMKKSTDI